MDPKIDPKVRPPVNCFSMKAEPINKDRFLPTIDPMKLFTYICILFPLFICAQTDRKIDSLDQIIENTKIDSVKIDALFEKSNLIEETNPSMSLQICELGLELSRQFRYRGRELQFLNNLGVLCYNMGAEEPASNYYQEVIKLTEKYNNYYDIKCRSFSNLGIIYHNKKDYSEALKCYENSIKLIMEKNLDIGMDAALHNIAYVHLDKAQYDSALLYFDRTHGIDHDSILSLSQLDEITSVQKKNDYAYTLAGAGQVYQKQLNYPTAFDFLKEALKLRLEVGYKIEITKSHNDLGTLFREQDNSSLAVKYFREGGLEAAEINLHKELLKSAKNQYEIYKGWNQTDSALKFHEIYLIAIESLKEEETESSLAQFKFQNNLDKIEQKFQKKSMADSILRIEQVKINEAQLHEEKTVRYSLLAILILIVIFLFFLYNRLRVIRNQKDLIKEKKQEVETAYEELNNEKKKVEEKNKVITDSMNYAKRIQNAILPENELMNSFFRKFFVFYQPKDIVGGDFYWYRPFNNLAVIATVDCTGHGVPGGFMSMMGSLLLDKIVQKHQLETSEILAALNQEIIRVLKQDGGGEIQDGMDISLCLIDKSKNEMHFSGARNGILLIQNGDIKQYKADLLPVGGKFTLKSKKQTRTYQKQVISLNKNDWVFMYSDGYHDQVGGEKFTSFGMRKFEQLLLKLDSSDNYSIEQLQKEFDNWKGDVPQVDDILVLGFQI